MSVQETLARASDALRGGDIAGARQILDTALTASPQSRELLGFAGILAAQSGAAMDAVRHFETLYRLEPHDLGARINLATALVAAARFGEASQLIIGHEAKHPRLRRLAAQIAQHEGDHRRAMALYRQVVADDPADWESWNNLGNALGAEGDLEGGISAIERAVQLRPDIRELYLNLALLLDGTDRSERRAKHMRIAAERFPDDPRILTELGLAEAAAREPAAAEAAFFAAIDRDPHCLPAYIELAMLLENRNRLDELAALVDRAETARLPAGELAFLRAWHLRRAGDIRGAMREAEQVPDKIKPLRRTQLIAELAERLGETDRAFSAFTQMNEAALASRPNPPGPTYRDTVEQGIAQLDAWLTMPWLDYRPQDGRTDPAFIVGFPRSGTTLLDTMLMNAPELSVMEELPVLSRIMGMHDAIAMLPRLSSTQIEGMRTIYYGAANELASPRPGTRILDKHPLHMTQVPLIHRLFPQAQIIFVERHPCDVVLSCFMANFQLNLAMRSFTDLTEAALTYDAVMRSWSHAIDTLPIQMMRVRYERMVTDTEAELRRATDFLGLEWRPEFTDNQRAAAQREHIRTASYSQVTEKIYTRALQRWERYRSHLEPVIPILMPWAERMGYTLD